MSTPMHHCGIPALVAGILCCGFFNGCKAQVSPKQLSDSFRSLADADVAFAADDFAKADELYEKALANGTVNADVLGEVRCKQAICKLKQQKADEAAKCLDDAEQASAFGINYYKARMELCLQRGDKAGAQKFWQQVRRADRNAKPPSGLATPK